MNPQFQKRKRAILQWFIAAIVIVTVGILILAKNYLANFGWKKFSDPNHLFNFIYPATWSITREGNLVQVRNSRKTAADIQRASIKQEVESYADFSLECGALSQTDDTSSAKAYLLQQKQKSDLEDQQFCASHGKPCLPRTPGFTQNYLADASGKFAQPNVSAVEVTPYVFAPDYGYKEELLTKKEYVLIVNKATVCTVRLIFPFSSKQHAVTLDQIDKIVKSAQFSK